MVCSSVPRFLQYVALYYFIARLAYRYSKDHMDNDELLALVQEKRKQLQKGITDATWTRC